MAVTFAEELLLLSMDEEYGEAIAIPARNLGYALAGSILMDLSLAERIDTGLDTLVVTNPEPLGDDLLDPVLADIVELPGEPRTPEFWVRRVAGRSEELRAQTLERLATQGVIEADDSGLFSLSRLARHARHNASAQGLHEAAGVRARIVQILFSEEIPDIRSVIIIGLAHACDMFQSILSETEYEEASERIQIIARLELLSRSVIEAIQNLTLVEAYNLQRAINETGGGWPRASGSLPVFGHALNLRDGLESFFVEQYQKMGPVFEISLFRKKYLILAGLEANQFFQREGKDYIQASRTIWPSVSSDFGATKIITALDGDAHRRLRRALRDSYSRKPLLQRIPECTGIIDRELAEFSPQDSLQVQNLMARIVIQQVGSLMLGTPAREYVDDIEEFVHALELIWLINLYPKFMEKMPNVRGARKRFTKLFDRVIEAHEPGLRVDAEPDLVDELLELRRVAPDFMTDTDIFMNVMGPYIAGNDTSTGATSFMLYCLLKNPDVLEQVRAEADQVFADGPPTPDGLRNMPITHLAVLETLRMYPIVPVLTRTVVNAFNFGGYWIPAGTDIWVAMTVPHHLPEIYPNPDIFDIGRFTPERQEHGQAGSYAPFGLGLHSCLGQGIAQIQMALIVATILHRAEIALDPPDYNLKIKPLPVPSPGPSFRIRISKWRHAPEPQGAGSP